MTRNQIAIVLLPSSPSPSPSPSPKLRATLIELLGPVGDFSAERAALLHHYAGKASNPPFEPTLNTSADKQREYLDAEHGWTTFHVDPSGCRDVDDALAWHKATDCWAITIADVASVVLSGSQMDRVACALGASFYDLEGRVVRPMIPPALSEEMASLLPSRDAKRGVTLFCAGGGGRPDRFARTWIRVEHSFTYDTFVASSLATDAARAFGLDSAVDPHTLIETTMLRYNQAVASVLATVGVGLLRVQDATSLPVMDVPVELRFLAMEAARYEWLDAERIAKGEQCHAAIGGLYCHASSPLRRYADLVNQRILVRMAPVETATEIAVHLNARTRANRRWGRDLTFLTHVPPGRVHEIDVIGFNDTHVWVPSWKRLVRIRHTIEIPLEPGCPGRMRIFCDPAQRNWKERIQTATAV